MKQELPISVILLALGAWCCFQLPSNSSKQTTSVRRDASEGDFALKDRGTFAQSSEQSPEQSLKQAHFKDYSVVQTSWEAPATNSTVTQALNAERASTDFRPANVQQSKSLQAVSDGTALRTFASADFSRIAAAQDVQATNEIAQVANGIQQLPAFATRTKISSRLFDVSMAATGKYFQAASGKKTRMEIQYVSPVAKTVLQMSDGRFVYLLKSDQQQQKLEFIDLFRLANDRGTARGGLLPTTWVVGGGIGKALSHYTDAFDFQKVTSSQQPQSGVTTYRGIWKAGVLLHLIHAGTPDADRPSKVVWKNVPRQLPHAIELTFMTAEGKAAIPKQISFFKFVTAKEQTMAQEMVRIEFSPFELKNELPDELFTLESTDFEATDVTKSYQSQILKLSQGMDKVANQGQSATGLR